MTGLAGAPSGGGLAARALRRVVLLLSLTQIVNWGVLYYAFPVLAPSIAESSSWTPKMVSGAFSMALLVTAVAGIPVGRAIDRFGPRAVMTAGSLLATPGVLGVAAAQSYPAFLAAWLWVGMATSALLYPPAFAALTRWGGPRRVTAITALTLVAGLSSTVFAPLTAVLEESLGWRGAYVVLAVALATVTLPAHWFGLRHHWESDVARPSDDGRRASPVWRTAPFVVLMVAMSAVALCVYAVVINLVPLLTERGLSLNQAAIALGLIGVGQLLGRLGYTRLSARTRVATRTALVFGAVATTTVVLSTVSGPAIAFFVVALLVGAARGVFSLIQATAVSDRWGTTGFGRNNGILVAPIMLATAAAPWVGTALAELLGSYSLAFYVLGGVATVAVLLAPRTIPRATRLDP